MFLEGARPIVFREPDIIGYFGILISFPPSDISKRLHFPKHSSAILLFENNVLHQILRRCELEALHKFLIVLLVDFVSDTDNDI